MAYSLYTFSAPNLPDNHAMMLTIPFVLYGIFRYLYLIHIKGEGGGAANLVYPPPGCKKPFCCGGSLGWGGSIFERFGINFLKLGLGFLF